MHKCIRLSETLRLIIVAVMAVAFSVASAQKPAPADGNDDFDYNDDTFRRITYTWVNDKGETVTSNLAEAATHPNQMRAFVAKIYSDNTIPGSKVVKYFNRTPTDPDKQLLTYNYDVKYPALPEFGCTEAPDPEQHGVTAILVELDIPEDYQYPYGQWGDRNNMQYVRDNTYQEFDFHSPYDDIFNNTRLYKSMQVLTERSHVKNGANPGYLFNIDKPLKHFFIVLKGKPRQEGINRIHSDIFEYFEQISPTTNDKDHLQQDGSTLEHLRHGEKYQVYHDCSTVALQDHYFCMNRINGVGDFEAEENLFVYIPEARMTYWSLTDPVSQYIHDYAANGTVKLPEGVNRRDDGGAYTWYNPLYAPYIFLYNIKLDIHGYRSDAYNHDITLTWSSNLSQITGVSADGLEQEFYIYPVSADGTIASTPLMYDEKYLPAPGQNGLTRILKEEGTGYLLVKSFNNSVAINFPEPHNAYSDPSRRIGYTVAGRVADKEFTPVMSNDVSHFMYSHDLQIVARLDDNKTKSTFIPAYNNYRNRYNNVVLLARNISEDRSIERGDLVEGSAFTLVRYDANGGSNLTTEVAVLTIESIEDAGDRYIYNWQIAKAPGYYGEVTASKGYFVSERTGDDYTDAMRPVTAPDMSDIYATFTDIFDADVEGNLHPSSYTYFFSFDPNGAVNDGGAVLPKKTNEVMVSIPKASIAGGLNTYTLAQINSDTDRHLPISGGRVLLDIANINNVNLYEVYYEGNAVVGKAERNNDGDFVLTAHLLDENTDVEIGKIHPSDFAGGICKASIPLLNHYDNYSRFYAVAHRTNGSTYGSAPAAAPHGPTLAIEDLKICRLESPEGYDNRYKIGQKNFRVNCDIMGYDTEYNHYNIWRTVSSPYYDGDKEELIRSHRSLSIVNKPLSHFESFRHFENFVKLHDAQSHSDYMHKDGFYTDRLNDDSPVTYTARVYIQVMPEGFFYDEDEEDQFVIAEASATSFYYGETTGKEDAISDIAGGIKVTTLGGGAIRVDGNGPVKVYNISGSMVASANDNRGSRDITLPSTGFYVVKCGDSAVKVQVN